MSSGEEGQSNKQPPYLDEKLLINTRLSEIEREQKEEKEYQHKHDSQQIRFNKWLVIFTGLLFFTSAVSDILIFRQWRETKRAADAAKSAADTARQALITVNRPWVEIVFTGTRPFTVGQHATVTIAVKNGGNTPAVDVAGFFRIERIRNGSSPILLSPPAPNIGGRQWYKTFNNQDWISNPRSDLHTGIMFPNDAFNFSVRGPIITATDSSDVLSGREYFALEGITIYADVMGDRHWTQYCNWGIMPVASSINYTAGECADYNKTDSNR